MIRVVIFVAAFVVTVGVLGQMRSHPVEVAVETTQPPLPSYNWTGEWAVEDSTGGARLVLVESSGRVSGYLHTTHRAGGLQAERIYRMLGHAGGPGWIAEGSVRVGTTFGRFEAYFDAHDLVLRHELADDELRMGRVQ